MVPTLGIDRHPQLVGEYFRNYKRVVYLAQTHSEPIIAAARQIAERLGLAFEYRFTGYGELASSLQRVEQTVQWAAWPR